MNLAQALRLNSSHCLALVGSGGKTTALFQLASGFAGPVIVTASAHLSMEQAARANRHLIAATPADLAPLEVGLLPGVTLITGPQEGERTIAISPATQLWLRAFCYEHGLPLLIEADGSRQRPLKAPAEHEPPLPAFVETVVVVVGLSALGQPLTDEWVHRPEIYARLSGLSAGETITSAALARVLLHPDGGLKNIPTGARRVALLNQADQPELQAQAKSLAEQLLPAYDAVIIASLHQKTVHAVTEPTAGIVLAAGEARRFGGPKQLLDYHGQPFVRAVAQAALEAGLSPVIVVTGAYGEAVEAALGDLPVKLVHNRVWQAGQSSSIKAGIEALPPSTGSTIFLLADQPQVGKLVLRALVERHAADLPAVVAPMVRDRRANPVLFDRATFPELQALSGDVGGRAIFNKYAPTYLPWYDESLLIDVDTPKDYRQISG
jgi:molybdenum cofactor cytidylyltransferase